MIHYVIGPVSLGLAAWEVMAWLTGKPTISELTRTPIAPLIFLWWLALGFHLIVEARRL